MRNMEAGYKMIQDQFRSQELRHKRPQQTRVLVIPRAHGDGRLMDGICEIFRIEDTYRQGLSDKARGNAPTKIGTWWNTWGCSLAKYSYRGKKISWDISPKSVVIDHLEIGTELPSIQES